MIKLFRCSHLNHSPRRRRLTTLTSRTQPCHSVKVTSTNSQLASPKRRFEERPSISYSIRKYDISGQEVAELLHASRAPFMDEGGAASPRQKHYSYWTTLPGSTHGDQFDTAIFHSIAVIAAFITVQDEEVRQGLTEGTSQNDPKATGNYGDGSDAWKWSLQYPDTSKPRLTKKLIGFARAIGDIALVATIYDLAVHPDLQGFGIGRRLVTSLVRQLYSKGIYDIGLVSSVGNASFFNDCSFEDDRQQSLCMTFTGSLPEQGWKEGLTMETQKVLLSQSLAEGATYSDIMQHESPPSMEQDGNGSSSGGSSQDRSSSSSSSQGCSSGSKSEVSGGSEGLLTLQNILALEQILRVHVHRPPVSDRPDKNSTVSNFWNYND